MKELNCVTGYWVIVTMRMVKWRDRTNS